MGAKPLESAPTGMSAKKCQVEEHSAEAVLWMIERMEPMLNDVVLPLPHATHVRVPSQTQKDLPARGGLTAG